MHPSSGVVTRVETPVPKARLRDLPKYGIDGTSNGLNARTGREKHGAPQPIYGVEDTSSSLMREVCWHDDHRIETAEVSSEQRRVLVGDLDRSDEEPA
jgi:hypothetical protein